MAWTTWNAFRFEYNESVVMQQAHAMIDSGLHSHWRDCHFDDTPCLSLLKHLLQVQGVQQNDSLANND